MDVTRANFSKVFEGLEKVVSESSFLAIDGEFTGLIDGGPDVAAYDTYSEYYAKLRNGSLNFLFVQFGLCAFKYNTDKKRWTHTAYNFYTFPRPFSRQAEDARFLCQSSSVDFLAVNGFDFNKLFREGISYLSAAEEERTRTRLAERRAQFSARNGTPGKEGNVPVPEDQAEFVKDTCLKLAAFVASKDGPRELVLPRCSAFQRKLVYQAAQESFAESVRLETRADAQRTFVAVRVGSPEEIEQLEEERRAKQVQEIDDAVGFSKVIRLLSSCGKLIAGHNMMLDMMHVLDQFCAPLPEDYDEFKEMLHETFPRLVDTKYMSASPPFKELIRSNGLSDLHSRLSEEPFSMPTVDCELGSGYPSTADNYHEAGFDALVTGLCLLSMASHLDPKLLHPDIATLPRLDKFVNKLLLYRMQDFGYIALGGNDPVLPRSHVFHVTIPKEWKQHDVVKLFQPVGPVFVSWVDDTSVFVALHEREKSSSVLKSVPRSTTYRVTPYAQHQAALGAASKQSLVPASPTTTAQRKRRSAELDAAAQGDADKRRKTNTPPSKGSRFSRRSIDPIAEEAETSSPSPKAASVRKATTKTTTTTAVFQESDVWG